MPRNYHHLSNAERDTIMRMRDRRISVSKIAAELGQHPATIYRELRRNFFYDDDAYFRGYFGRVAHQKAASRRVRGGKITRNRILASRIAKHLVHCWTPEQIAGRLRLDEADPITVCHETIYQYVSQAGGRAPGVQDPAVNPMFDLSSRAALITGSTRGIGRAIAEAMIAAGARVMISSEHADDTARVSAELGQPGHACDVTDDAALGALVEGTVAALGGLDILVCNAGITGRPGPFATIDMDDYARVMAINLRSLVVLANLARPHLARRGGNAVFIASLAGLRGNGAINAYALAKAGVAQLARNLAVEWGPHGMRANAVSPGFIATELSQPLLDNAAFMGRRMAMTPLRRPGTPAEVAGAVVFLASVAGGFVTGHNLVVDGGTLITDGG